jgi:hypothetical protein
VEAYLREGGHPAQPLNLLAMIKLDAPRKTDISDKLAYSGMALAFLATASEAEGQIVYTDLDPDVAVSFSTYGVDINNDGTVELEITRTEFGSMHYVGITDQAAGVSVLGHYYSNKLFVDRLQQGDPIAAGNSYWWYDPTAWLVSFYSYGQWASPGDEGFLGVRFQAEGDTLYGWIELEMAYNTSYVKGYAYESAPGTSINAGDIGLPTGIPGRTAGAEAISLHPVPAEDRLTITGLTEAAELRVMNLAGQVMEDGRSVIPGTTGQATLEVGAWPSGTYLVEIRQAGRAETRSFVKQ